MRITGIAHRNQLRDRGVGRRARERALREGRLVSVQPWYHLPDAPPDVLALLRLGVRPTCVDAAALYGLWVPIVSGVHVFRPRSRAASPVLDGAMAAQIRRRDGRPVLATRPHPLVLHGPDLQSWPSEDPVPPFDLVLEHAGRCLPAGQAAILFESALHRGHLTMEGARRIIARLPQRRRGPLQRIRCDAESGTETVVRWWLESNGVRVRSQVPFPDGRRRMDLLVGERWVIECDSRAHHDDPRSYDEDRERDLYLRSYGYEVTRLSWEQVFLRWPETERLLLAILRSGAHHRPLAG